jgi:hypothetical protein
MTKKLTCQKCEWAVLFPSGPRDIRNVFVQSLAQAKHIAERHRELLEDMPNPATMTDQEVDALFSRWFKIEDLQEA